MGCGGASLGGAAGADPSSASIMETLAESAVHGERDGWASQSDYHLRFVRNGVEARRGAGDPPVRDGTGRKVAFTPSCAKYPCVLEAMGLLHIACARRCSLVFGAA